MATATAQTASHTETRRVPLPDGRVLSVDVTVGDVQVAVWDQPDAEIVIERTAPDPAALSGLPVEVKETDDAVRVVVTQPDGRTDPGLTSTVRLTVPATAEIEHVQILEGQLTVRGLEGAIRADVRRGGIDAEDIGGQVRFETGIGDLDVRRPHLREGGLLRLRAFNGDIRLAFDGAPPDARIMALALNGTITSDIPLHTKDRWGPRWGEATLGAGRPVVSLDIITGVIAIRTK
ncbi:MAG: hypothetical protein AB7O67_01230 [Vicinamibacterales bacterium]